MFLSCDHDLSNVVLNALRPGVEGGVIDLREVAGKKCMGQTEDRTKSLTLEETYVQQWTRQADDDEEIKY